MKVTLDVGKLDVIVLLPTVVVDFGDHGFGIAFLNFFLTINFKK